MHILQASKPFHLINYVYVSFISLLESLSSRLKDQELWGTLEQDCLRLVSAKNSKGVSDWSIQVCMRAVERAACLACER